MPDFTITVDVPTLVRIRRAYGRTLNLDRDATAQEVKDRIIRQMKAEVRAAERAIAEAALVPTADIEPT